MREDSRYPSPIVLEEPSGQDARFLERAQLIRDQIEAIRALLLEADRRALDSEERSAVSELAKACAELTDAARSLLRP